MPEVYAIAAVRHFQDAEELAALERFDGAGHLIGFAAECAIKHSVKALRPINQAPHLHLPKLVEKAKKLLHGRRRHTLYTLLERRAFMDGWEVDQRYSDDGTVTRILYQMWRRDASRALGAAGLWRMAR